MTTILIIISIIVDIILACILYNTRKWLEETNESIKKLDHVIGNAVIIEYENMKTFYDVANQLKEKEILEHDYDLSRYKEIIDHVTELETGKEKDDESADS